LFGVGSAQSQALSLGWFSADKIQLNLVYVQRDSNSFNFHFDQFIGKTRNRISDSLSILQPTLSTRILHLGGIVLRQLGEVNRNHRGLEN